MNGTQIGDEILSALSRIETQLEHNKDDINKLCNFKDYILKTAQEFRDYKDSRKDLPENISKLAGCVALLEHRADAVENRLSVNEKKADFLMAWYWRGAGALAALVILDILLRIYSDMRGVIVP